MVFKKDTWFRQFLPGGSTPSNAKEYHQDKVGGERAFDIVDTMEKGLAREVSTEFVHPLRRSSKLWRFHIVRSEDKLEYRLYSDDAEFLLYAKTQPQLRKIEFFLYNPAEASTLYDPKRPAFTMTYDESKSRWRLVKEHCELCQFRSKHRCCDKLGKQQLVYIQWSRERPFNDDVVINSMEIQIPGVFSDGSRVVWCPAAGHQNLGTTAGINNEALVIGTRQPDWNDEVERLVLDFKGRSVLASAKNFQLSFQQKPDLVICQHGKIGPSTFSLDFRYPLSVSQAFGISMASMFWT